MKIKLISLVLIFSILSSFMVAVADEASLTEGAVIVSDFAIENDRYSINNICDGSLDTIAVLSPAKNAEFSIEFAGTVNIEKLSVSTKNFSGWNKIKSLEISFDNGNSADLKLENSNDSILTTELVQAQKGVKNITFKIAELYGTQEAVGIAEISFSGTANFEGSSEEAELAERTLVYGKDFSYKKANWKVSDPQNWFDNNVNTRELQSPSIKGTYVVYEFTYPTDVTEFVYTPVVNSDWAVTSEFEFGVYNEENIFRSLLKYPEPIYSAKYPASTVAGTHTIDLRQDELFKGITHLMIKSSDVRIFKETSSWGGFSEMKIKGIKHTEKQKTSEIIKTSLDTNAHMIYEWGLVEKINGEEDNHRIPTRMEAVDAILKLNGEYEKASNYVGTFNFNDIPKESPYYNRLSYVFAYKRFGIVGDGTGCFNPDSPVTPQAMYKMLLSYMGYNCGEDYEWDTMYSFLRSKVAGDSMYCEPFAVKDMSNCIYEMLSLNPKNETRALSEILYDKGIMPESAWNMFVVKNDRKVERDLSEYIPPETANRSGDFTFELNDSAKLINDYHFCYNVCYHYSGSYYGTLPKDDPRNLREKFNESLQKIGAKTMRFPGGNTVHYYFYEGERFGKQLLYDIEDHVGVKPSGFYDPDDPDDKYYTDFWNFMDFCNEYGYDILLQVNPSFFVDENGTEDTSDDRIRMAYPEMALKTNPDGSISTIPGYYDHNRIDEAAEQLRRNIKRMKEKGYNVTKWEIGNEDHWKNTGGQPYENNQYVKDCFEAIIAYAKVINEEIDNPTIIIDGFDLQQAMDVGYLTDEDLKLLDGIAPHYPFARWAGPLYYEARTNPSMFAAVNDVHFEQSWNNNLAYTWLLERMTTETTTYRFQLWSSSSIQQTFGSALSTAHNWGQVIFDTGFNLVVLHDLESPWFGYILHDSTFNPGYGYFNRHGAGYANLMPDDIPDHYKFYDRYFTSSAGVSIDILSNHIGGTTLDALDSNMDRLVSAYASVKDKELMITVVNRLNDERPVNIKFNNLSIAPQDAKALVFTSDDITAVFETDYTINEDVVIPINGNIENNTSNAISFTATPFSVTQLVVNLE